MIGKTLGRYSILARIGAGGMGEVYRAHDSHLDRDVAIKVLPQGLLTDEPARKRFRKEAEALSKLNHPNIAIVHDFDTHDGVDHLVMEFVTGESLNSKLKVGPLSERECIELGGQIASALDEAHDHGVIHRDLKPGNVMVTAKGQAKVLDFGLARLLRPDTDDAPTESVTQAQDIAGTLPYMAPELLRGEPADSRTDIWAAGVVLYEMATGHRPFEAKPATALAADIQYKPVRPPTQLNPEVSARLEQIILKCLEKHPESRYQSAKELIVELRRPAIPIPQVAAGQTREESGRPRTRRKRPRSLAVLPLASLSGDLEQEYFADGMTEALITDLSKIGALKVISRTSAMRYKGTDKSLPEIARELNVDAILEGSVLRVGERVRITAQLIHAPTDEHLWAESYERDLSDVLALQSDVARAVAHEVRIKLSPHEAGRLTARTPVNPQAYDAYLRGRYYWNRRTVEDFKRSLEFFNRAIELDPAYAPTYAGIADTYNLLGSYGALPMNESHPRARAAAMNALKIDEQLGEAHASLGTIIADYYWDWAEAEKEFRRAIQLSPNYPVGRYWYANYLMFMGRFDEALTEARRAEEFDPLNSIVPTYVGIVLYHARRYDEAITQLRRVLQFTPDFAPAHSYIGLVYIQKQMFAEAIASFRQACSGTKNDVQFIAYTGYAFGADGNLAEARRIRNELQHLSTERYVSPFDVAVANLGAGDNDRALDCLEMCYEERNWFLGGLKVDPLCDPLRCEPRFEELLRRMNFPK